jgi:uncharacterized protein YabN with tetrapyrrole methylase and pyrophosphatase domain
MEKADFSKKEHFSFEDLYELVGFLRSPDGCPWDSVQTHTSIRNNFIEETYEAVEGTFVHDAYKVLRFLRICAEHMREFLPQGLNQWLLHVLMHQ